MPTKEIKNRTYIRRMCQHAELRAEVWRPGDKTMYRFYDARDKAERFPLFVACGGTEAAAFISGYTAGRNREIIR